MKTRTYHRHPAGSPRGGQFASKGAGAGLPKKRKLSKKQKAAIAGVVAGGGVLLATRGMESKTLSRAALGVADKLPRKARVPAVEGMIRFQRKEHAIGFGAGRKIVGHNIGTADQVEVRSLYNRGAKIVTHNHPNVRGLSGGMVAFSDSDIAGNRGILRATGGRLKTATDLSTRMVRSEFSGNKRESPTANAAAGIISRSFGAKVDSRRKMAIKKIVNKTPMEKLTLDQLKRAADTTTSAERRSLLSRSQFKRAAALAAGERKKAGRQIAATGKAGDSLAADFVKAVMLPGRERGARRLDDAAMRFRRNAKLFESARGGQRRWPKGDKRGGQFAPDKGGKNAAKSVSRGEVAGRVLGATVGKGLRGSARGLDGLALAAIGTAAGRYAGGKVGGRIDKKKVYSKKQALHREGLAHTVGAKTGVSSRVTGKSTAAAVRLAKTGAGKKAIARLAKGKVGRAEAVGSLAGAPVKLVPAPVINDIFAGWASSAGKRAGKHIDKMTGDKKAGVVASMAAKGADKFIVLGGKAAEVTGEKAAKAVQRRSGIYKSDFGVKGAKSVVKRAAKDTAKIAAVGGAVGAGAVGAPVAVYKGRKALKRRKSKRLQEAFNPRQPRWPKGSPRGGQFRGMAAKAWGALAATQVDINRRGGKAVARDAGARAAVAAKGAAVAGGAAIGAGMSKAAAAEARVGAIYRGDGGQVTYSEGVKNLLKAGAKSNAGKAVVAAGAAKVVREMLPAARRQRGHSAIIKYDRDSRIAWQKSQEIFGKNGDEIQPGDMVRFGPAGAKAGAYLGAEWRPHGANPTTTGRMVIQRKDGSVTSVKYTDIKSRSKKPSVTDAADAMSRAKAYSKQTIAARKRTPNPISTVVKHKLRRGTKARQFAERELKNEARNMKRSTSLSSQVAGRALERGVSYTQSKDFGRKYKKHTRPKSRYTHAKKRVAEDRARPGDKKLIRNYEKRTGAPQSGVTVRTSSGRVSVTKSGIDAESRGHRVRVRLQEAAGKGGDQKRWPKGDPRGGQFAPQTMAAAKSIGGFIKAQAKKQVELAKNEGTVGIGQTLGGMAGAAAGSTIGGIGGTLVGTPIGGIAGGMAGGMMGYGMGSDIGRQLDRLPGLNKIKITQGQSDLAAMGLGVLAPGRMISGGAEKVAGKAMMAAGNKMGSRTVQRAGLHAAQAGKWNQKNNKEMAKRAVGLAKEKARAGSLAKKATDATIPNLKSAIKSVEFNRSLGKGRLNKAAVNKAQAAQLKRDISSMERNKRVAKALKKRAAFRMDGNVKRGIGDEKFRRQQIAKRNLRRYNTNRQSGQSGARMRDYEARKALGRGGLAEFKKVRRAQNKIRGGKPRKKK